MIKVLVVDDNRKRVERLKKRLFNSELKDFFELKICETADEARIATKNIHYDLLILDVVLPKKHGNTPHSSVGINLLGDFHTNKRYLSPSKIIGITAHISDISTYKSDFEKFTSIVIEAVENSSDWIETILTILETSINTEIKKQTFTKKSILITIHGIRTSGDWQEDLKQELSSFSPNFDFYSIKYGFFSLFSFILPFMREKKFNDINNKINQIILDNEDKKIYVIAHSFGTYLIAKFLLQFDLDKKIELVIFSGSVLNKNFLIQNNFDKKVNKIINDCGNSDYVLIINKIFVWGFSDAGRIGFTNANSPSFCNRYFKGGHSLYFNKSFYKKYWIPQILIEHELEPINIKNKWHSDFSEFFYGFMEIIKHPIYIISIIYIVYNVMEYIYYKYI